jgi:hypothetical protein
MNPEMTERRYPFPYVKPDRSGRVAAQTLEYFVHDPTSHAVTELLRDPILGNMLAKDSGDKALRVRLLRYTRQGLLSRKWESGEYRYKITRPGENRLIYLWERAGLLDPEKADSQAAKEEMKLRLKTRLSILRSQEEELQEKVGFRLSGRAPSAA